MFTYRLSSHTNLNQAKEVSVAELDEKQEVYIVANSKFPV